MKRFRLATMVLSFFLILYYAYQKDWALVCLWFCNFVVNFGLVIETNIKEHIDKRLGGTDE
jgi:hypothetical protein